MIAAAIGALLSLQSSSVSPLMIITVVSQLQVYHLFTFFLPYLKHPQTSSPGDCCQDDRFMSGEQNHPSGTLSHRDLPDSLMKVGAHTREMSYGLQCLNLKSHVLLLQIFYEAFLTFIMQDYFEVIHKYKIEFDSTISQYIP